MVRVAGGVDLQAVFWIGRLDLFAALGYSALKITAGDDNT